MKNKNYSLYFVDKFEDFKDMLDQSSDRFANRIAFRYTENKEDCEISYSAFRKEVNCLGTAISSKGIHGKHIAMVGENCYQWILTYLTVLGSDNVYIPIDKELPENELFHIINDSDAEVLFFTKSFDKVFRNNRDKLPDIKYYFSWLSEKESDESITKAEELLEEGEKLIEEGNRSYLDIKPADEELGMMVYTSGTTGASKGVMLSRHNLVSSVYYGQMVSGVYTTALSVLPYNHTYEAVCDLLVSLQHGSTICINENLKTVAANMKKYQPDYMMLVPLFVENFYKKIWKTLEAQGKADTVRKAIKYSNMMRKLGIDLRPKLFKQIRDVFGGKMIKIVCGGAPIRPELAEFFDGIGINLVNGYGITECSPLVSANRDFYNNFSSVGVVLPCCDIYIDEPNEDGEGEILVKGDIVMMGYYKNPEKTAEALIENGWFRTGDYGKIAEDQLFITGRKKNLIVLKNGKNVYPEEIEEYLAGINGIAELVVYSVKDSNGDEIGLKAEIYPDQDFSKGKSLEEIEKYFLSEINKVSKDLPSYKHVHNVVIRDKEFEKTTSRKIKRTGLGS